MEDLKKRFIVDEKVDEKRIREFVERVLPFCRVTKNGGIILEKNKLTTAEKVKIALVARFLAHSLDDEIPAEVGVGELSNSLLIPKDQVTARLKELKDKGIAFRVGKGVYKVNLVRIDEILKNLENKYGIKNEERR